MKKYILIIALTFFYLNTYAQSTSLTGLYKCSSEDLIRLNSDGTGNISITSEVPSELRYEMQPIYLTLNVRIVNGKIAFEHYTPGPTFLYVKQ